MLIHRIRLILVVCLAAIGFVFLAGSVATAQGPAPATATATFTPTKVVTSTVAVTFTATTVPPTATKVPPTATLIPPTATKVPPTFTLVPPTATKVPPTATLIPPTATKAPATVASPAPTYKPRSAYGPKIVPAPGSGFVSAFRVQNLGAGITQCSYVFYDGSGNAVLTSAQTPINPGDSMFVYTPNFSSTQLPSGTYSAVVSCTDQVAAVVNFSQPQAGGLNSSGDVYNGIASPASTWYAPNVFNNYYNYYTNAIVQNATSGSVDITVSIYAPGSTTPFTSQTATNVAAFASTSFDQSTLSALSPNVAYSAKIAANVSGSPSTPANIATIMNIYGLGPRANELYSYNAFAAGATTLYAPVIMNNYWGYTTALTVQNIGGSPTNIHVAYGSGQTQDYNGLAPNSSWVFYTPNSGIPAGNNSLTSATITSSGSNIVALINENNNYNRASSYNAFAATTSTTVRAPIVMRNYYNYNTSVTCQNLGGSPTNMTLSYAGVAGTQVVNNVAALQTALFYQATDSLIGDNFLGSATITSSGQPITCVVNEDQNQLPYAAMMMDQLYAYNAINQ